MTGDRVTYDGDEIDEIVLSNATVHLERLDQHWSLLVIRRDDGVLFHLQVRDVTEFEVENRWYVENELNPPLDYGTECSHTWVDRSGSKHRCVKGRTHNQCHRCECGTEMRRPVVS